MARTDRVRARRRAAARRARRSLLALLGLFVARRDCASWPFSPGDSTAPRRRPVALTSAIAVARADPAPLAARRRRRRGPRRCLRRRSKRSEPPVERAPPPKRERAAPGRRPRRAGGRAPDRARSDRRHRGAPLRRARRAAASLAGAPFAARRGRVVQLGAYATRAQADAAWRRLVGAIPISAPCRAWRAVSRPSPRPARYYRLRLGARSRREARACAIISTAIGRGCMRRLDAAPTIAAISRAASR